MIKNKYFKFVILFFFITTAHISFSKEQILPTKSKNNKTDSLKSILNNTTDLTSKISLLNEIANIYSNSNPDSAIIYYRKALKTAYITEQPKQIAKCLSIFGNFYTNQGNYANAKILFKKSLIIYESISDKNGIAKSFSNIGTIYSRQGVYEKALSSYLNSLKIYENISDQKGISNCYNNIGIIYSQQGLYEKAIEYYKLSLKIAESINNKMGIANCYHNIGNVYSRQENHLKAMDYYSKSLNIYKDLNDRHSISICYSIIGNSHRNLGNYDDAVEFYEKALKIDELINDKEGIASNLINIAGLKILANKNKAAIDISLKSLEIAKEIGSLPLQNISYKSLANANENLGNYNIANSFYKLFFLTKDSIYNIEKSKQIADLQVKYETEKKEDKIKSLQKDKELQKLQISRERLVRNIILIFSATFFIIIIVVLLYIRIWRIKEKVELEKKILELEQKSLLYQMNPHFIFNSLNSVSTQMINDINSAREFLAKFSRLMRLILENSRCNYVSLENEIDIIKYYLSLEQQRHANFEFRITIDEEITPQNFEIPPMFIQPHVENAILHGIQKKDSKGFIDIRFSKISDNEIKCEIEDNGIGRKKSNENISNLKLHKSLATEITKERLEILKLENKRNYILKIVDLETNLKSPCGTLVTITLPMKMI